MKKNWASAPRWLGDGQYHPQIDGLRAIAIISVVGFHVGLPGFYGGFIGVDVFFVISGFLITTLLLRELHQRGSINLLGFFARRARRLLPAFFLVVATTLILGFLFLMPVDDEQQHLADSTTAASLYVSNLFFGWNRDDYFAPDSSLYPLLHTWSLAVEEQFYLLWPLILIGAAWTASRWRFGITSVVAAVLTVLIVASLWYSWEAAESGGRNAHFAFFALTARAWELGLGASLAILLPTVPRAGVRSGTVLTLAGVIAIGAAVAMFSDNMAFPGIAALLPTLGAAAIIAGVWLAPNTTIAMLLSSRPLVVIGLLSYSWYLWHWPLLAIARARALGVEDLSRDGMIVVAALGLAWLTYRLIEEPVRSRRVAASWSNPKLLGAGAAASLLLLAGAQGLEAHANHLAKTYTYRQLEQAENDKGWSQLRCRNDDDEFDALILRSECMGLVNVRRKILIVWGDSFADHIVGALEAADRDGRFAVLPRWMAGCPPLLGIVRIKDNQPYEECAEFNAEVVSEMVELQREGRLAGVVLAGRWSMYLGKPASKRKQARAMLWQKGRPLQGEAAAVALADALSSTLRTVAQEGTKVLVIAPTPEQPFDVPDCLARRSLESCSIDQILAETHRAVALRALQKAVTRSGQALLWDPLPALCQGARCLVKRDGIIIYSDDQHLTYRGSRWLGAYLARSLPWSRLFGAI